MEEEDGLQQGGSDLMKLSPLSGAMIAFISGLLILIILLIPDPLGMEDLDDDGISDLFQDVEVRSELVLSDSGEWREIEIGHVSEMNLGFTSFVGGGLLIILPAAVYFLVNEGPRRREEMERKIASSAMLDNVRRISSFLSANPSLPQAVRLSHMSQLGQGERVLGQVLWSSRTTGSSIEQSLAESSKGLGDPVLASSVEGLISAEGESTLEDVRRACDSVVRRMGERIGERMSSYALSLKGPATALFALGVLLPVLLATMIPIAGFSLTTVIMIGSLLWIAVPLLILRTGRTLVLRRPMVPDTRDIGPFHFHFSLMTISGVSMGFLIFTISIFLLMNPSSAPVLVDGPFPDTGSTLILGLLSGSSILISSITAGVIHSGTMDEKRFAKDMEKVPDMLSEIGTGLMEGRSFERSVVRGFKRVDMDPPLRSTMPEKEGVLRRILLVAREYSRAGSRTGGSSIKALANHMREMGRLDRTMKEMIRSSIGQMETTSSIFAPVMIGISVGIFDLMGRSSSTMEGGEMIGASMSPGELTVPGFILLSGVYLLLLSITTTVTMKRLEEGRPDGGFGKVPRNLMLSSITFTAGVVLSTLLLGG